MVDTIGWSSCVSDVTVSYVVDEMGVVGAVPRCNGGSRRGEGEGGGGGGGSGSSPTTGGCQPPSTCQYILYIPGTGLVGLGRVNIHGAHHEKTVFKRTDASDKCRGQRGTCSVAVLFR